jgi:hypothetical protein
MIRSQAMVSNRPPSWTSTNLGFANRTSRLSCPWSHPFASVIRRLGETPTKGTQGKGCVQSYDRPGEWADSENVGVSLHDTFNFGHRHFEGAIIGGAAARGRGRLGRHGRCDSLTSDEGRHFSGEACSLG